MFSSLIPRQNRLGSLPESPLNYGLSHANPMDLDMARCVCAQANADLFLTNDKRLVGKIVSGIQFIATLDTQLF